MNRALAYLRRRLASRTESPGGGAVPDVERLRDSYLSLMEASLTGTIYEDKPLEVLGTNVYDGAIREVGRDGSLDDRRQANG